MRIISPALLILFILFPAIAQTQERSRSNTLPQGYRGMNLRMPLNDVRNRLLNDPWFDYRGEPSLSMRETPNSSFIDAGGSLFISRGLFQFEPVEIDIPVEEAQDSSESSRQSIIEYQLSAIILELNPRTLDWYTVYTTLEKRYGQPDELNPQRAWWQNARIRLALERPLTVKYLDQSVFRPEANQASNPVAARATARTNFLKDF